MNKEEIRKKFEENVLYLKRNIPPDDIYMFSEQTFMAAMYFMHRWAEWVDLREEALKDPVAKKWMINIMALAMAKDQNQDMTLDLDMKSVEE